MSDSKEFISQVTPNIFATILDLEVFEQGEQEMEKGVEVRNGQRSNQRNMERCGNAVHPGWFVTRVRCNHV